MGVFELAHDLARANVFAVAEQHPRDAGSSSGDERDPRAKEAALRRLHGASDEVLAVFEHNLHHDARAAGASEQEIRDAQVEHPEHP
jgi:hypothetical protein